MDTVSWNNEMARSFSLSNIIFGKFQSLSQAVGIFVFLNDTHMRCVHFVALC